MKVLVIEDDSGISEYISLAFRVGWPDTQVVITNNGEAGVLATEKESPDVILLDLGLPDITGFEVLKQIRLFSKIPVIIQTVRKDEADIVRGLENGADEYIVKPFGQMELLARVKSILRRDSLVINERSACGPFQFTYNMRSVVYDNREIQVTLTEGLILRYLAENEGRVIPYHRMIEKVWGEDYLGGVDTLKVYIHRLRVKLEEDPSSPRLILTKTGSGYFLAKQN